MILRRTIAAFLVTLLVGLVSAPAFAGMLACAMEDDACCCAKDDTSNVATTEAPDCECPGCACVIKAAHVPVPFHTTTVEIEQTVDDVVGQPDPTRDLEASITTELAVPDARGPPGSPAAPLYILYDTLLI